MTLSRRPLHTKETNPEGSSTPLKRCALIAIFILLALSLCACAQTQIAAVEPEATPTLSTKLLASVRSESETAQLGPLPVLNTDEHILYLEPVRSGRRDPDAAINRDGLLRIAPDEPMTRADVISALYKLLENPVTGQCSFSDVSEDDGVYEALCCLTAWGVVSDSTGEFDPDGLCSRAQLMTMLSRFYPCEQDDAQEPYVGSFFRRGAQVERLPDGGMASFEDIRGHWAESAIENAVDRGWIEAGGKFYPDAAVTRAQFCHVLNAVLGRSGDAALAAMCGEYDVFADLSSDHEYYADVIEAACEHDFAYDENGVEYWRGADLEPGLQRADGWLYYVNEDGSILRNGSVQQWDFDENGRYTTGVAELDEMLRSILLEIGADDMSQGSALRAAYLYCTYDHVYIYHNWYTYGFDGVNDEFAFRALRFFKSGGGYCYDYAAGFGLLARALGYNCYIVKAQVNQYYAPHGFVVIPENGINYIYDPEMESTRPERHADYGLFRIQNGAIYDYWYTPWW